VNLTKPHVGSILNLISKQIEKKGFECLGLDLLDFFIWYVQRLFHFIYKFELLSLIFYYSLRITLINDNKSVRGAGLRVIRICLLDKSSVQTFVKANLHHFVAK